MTASNVVANCHRGSKGLRYNYISTLNARRVLSTADQAEIGGSQSLLNKAFNKKI